MVLVVLSAIFIFYPLLREIKKSSAELISQKTNLLFLEQKIKNSNELKGIYKVVEPNLREINNLFIDSEVPIDFISFLERISKESRVDAKISFNASDRTKEDGRSFLNFQLNTNSSYPNFLKFINKIETAPYLTEIQNLNISQSGEANVVQAAVLLKVYTK